MHVELVVSVGVAVGVGSSYAIAAVVAQAHAVPVIAALEARGLPVLSVDLVPLQKRMIVRDLVQLTRALHDPADRSAWLAVLRAPWCGARLVTLTALSRLNERELLIDALSDDTRLARCDPVDRPRLERVRAILAAALAARGLAAPADWLEATWIELGRRRALRAAALVPARPRTGALRLSTDRCASRYPWWWR